MSPKAVCFDMDGVIVDSEPAHFEAFRQLLKSSHKIELDHAEYQHHFAGRTTKRGLESFFEQAGFYADIDGLLATRQQIYLEIARSGLKSYPSTLLTVEKLSQRVPLALVTSAIRTEVDLVLEQFSLQDVFSVIVCADDVSHGKPNPESYLLASARLHTPASDCVVVEDAPSGIAAAKAAGMHCVAVRTSHNASELSAADIVVDSLKPSLFF